MKQFLKTHVSSLIAVAALCGMLGIALYVPSTPNHVFAQVGPSGSFVLFPSGSDPCSNPSIPKSQVKVAISTATTTELVAAAAGKSVYGCAFQASDVGTSPTLVFEYGTKVSTACDTGATALTGTIVVATGTILAIHPSATFVQTIAANELCLVSGGTTPSVQGYFTYVQQ